MRFSIALPSERERATRLRGHRALGERFRLARLRRKFSMEVVATRAGISRTTLYKVERGDPAGLENDLQQIFRRVAFNVAVGNRDDHLRNHGFILGEGGWHLAPAFDVNPDPEKATHVLAIDDADTRPDVATVLANPVPVVVPYLP